MKLSCKAYAKINLTLEVLARRGDGYHQVATVLQSIDLADELAFEPAAGLTVECDDPAIAPEDNLVLRAARLLQATAKTGLGARVTMSKRIPVAAGLGGGSSDAAAALRGSTGCGGLKFRKRPWPPWRRSWGRTCRSSSTAGRLLPRGGASA